MSARKCGNEIKENNNEAGILVSHLSLLDFISLHFVVIRI